MNAQNSTARLDTEALEPHPVLSDYYADQAERRDYVRGLFDRTARHYNPIDRMLSFGTGPWYRRRTLARAGLAPGMRLLDVATGTGLIARCAAESTGAEGAVVGIDLSHGMLREARRGLDLGFVQGAATRLPVADQSFDFVTVGYALRHFGDLAATFREFHRVLRPGGKILMLEIGRPAPGLARALTHFYVGRLVPWLCRWTTGGKETQTLMRYHWDTIEQCVPPETILSAIRTAGFRDARCDVELGVFRTYLGKKR